MKHRIGIIALSLSLLVACAKEDSENVNQDSIYSIYELHFNKSQDKTTARATFRFGGPTGTLLDLSDPAKVTFEGDELLHNSTLGFHSKTYAGFKDSGAFQYTDLDNKVFNNSTKKLIPIDFTSVDTIDANAAHTFTWTGVPVQDFETVSVTIDGTMQDNFEIFTTSLTGATQIILSANRLQKLGKGMAKCILKRSYNRLTIAEATSKGGRINTDYEVEKMIYIK